MCISTRVAVIEAEIRELERRIEQRELALSAAVAELVDDLAFQDIPTKTLKGAAISTTKVHYVEMTHEDGSPGHTSPHSEEHCPGLWCDPKNPAQRLKWGRTGKGTWMRFRGSWEVVARLNSRTDSWGNRKATVVCIPDKARKRRNAAG